MVVFIASRREDAYVDRPIPPKTSLPGHHPSEGKEQEMKTNNNKKTMMSGLVLTLPIAAGKVEAWRRFCQELSGSRQQLHAASRRRLGITSERLVLVETAF